MKLEDISIHAWLISNNFKTSNGEPYNLRDHMFWFDILADDFAKQVWLKAPQVGGTEAALIKALYKAKKNSMNVIYTMPTQDDVRGLVKGKLNPIIDNNPVVKSYCEDTDTVDLKRIGKSNFYFKGTMTQRAALSITGDWLINDEEDRGNQLVLEQFTSRSEYSKYQWELHFSNPSAQGHGVSKYWERSDKRHWFITCHSCQKKQYLSWPESIDIEREVYVCKHCNEELTDEDRRVGEWHPMKTDYVPEYHGYWISLLMCPWVPASRIIDRFKTKSREYFWNFVLGLPYVGSGNKVLPNMINQNLISGVNPEDGRIVIGVDTGTTTYYVCSNRRGLFYYGKCEGYEDIERLLKRWPESVAVFDAQGDLMQPRDLQDKYPGRVYLCFFREDRKTQQLLTWGEGEELGTVVADKHRLVQLIVDEFTDKRWPIYGSEEDWMLFTEHWGRLYRIVEVNKLGREVKRWHGVKPDHWASATWYCRVGLERFGGDGGGISLPDIEVTNEFAVPIGYDNTAKVSDFVRGEKQHDWRDV